MSGETVNLPSTQAEGKSTLFKGLFFLTLFVGLTFEFDRGWSEFLPWLRSLYSGPSGPSVIAALAWGPLYFLSAASLLVFFLLENPWLRLPGTFLFFFFTSVLLGFKSINGYGFDFVEAMTFLLHPQDQFTGEALSTFLPVYGPSVFLTAVLTGVLSFLAPALLPRLKSKFVLVPILCSALVFSTIHATRGMVTIFPSLYKIPMLTLYAWSNALFSGNREQVSFYPSASPIASHVVLIVDESIRGDMLSLNGYDRPTTPFLRSCENTLLNFGIACSSTNRSADSNIILQSGMRPDSIPDRRQKGLKEANIFQYARAAGFRTIFINGQISADPAARPPNFMTAHDFDSIDERYAILFLHPGIKQCEIDRKILDYLETVWKSASSSFTYVVKMGAHFHYEDRYPQERKVFQPTLDPPGHQRIFQPNLSFGGNASSREKIINSYGNCLRWAVDGFFEELLGRASGTNALLLYTSDHGQNLMDNGATITHCQTFGANPPQGNVPLILLSPDAQFMARVKSRFPGADRNRNRLTHFQIFPTILIFFGYDKSEVGKKYGNSIFDDPPLKRFFFSGDIFDRSENRVNEFPPAPPGGTL